MNNIHRVIHQLFPEKKIQRGTVHIRWDIAVVTEIRWDIAVVTESSRGKRR